MNYGLKGLGMSGQVHNKNNNLIFDYFSERKSLNLYHWCFIVFLNYLFNQYKIQLKLEDIK
jgi:hypothetical protein